MRSLALRPDYAYSALWLELADRRLRVPSTLAAESGKFDGKAWPAPIVLFYLGHTKAADVLAAARNRDPFKTGEQTCEANFYIAELLRVSGDRNGAVPHYLAAARGCPHHYTEWGTAREALRTLGIKPP
jgi:lipoprotein NlpI